MFDVALRVLERADGNLAPVHGGADQVHHVVRCHVGVGLDVDKMRPQHGAGPAGRVEFGQHEVPNALGRICSH